MKIIFLVIGLIINVFFMWTPINGMQPPRTPSKTLVHERKASLPNIGKPTNQWSQIILQIPKDQESLKIDLLRLLEWDAYQKNEKLDLQIYSSALSDLKQERFNYGKHRLGEKAIPPLLNPHFNVSNIENNALKPIISSILKDRQNAIVGNFNHKINNYTSQIQTELDTLHAKPYLKSQIQTTLDKLITKQLEQIEAKANFTQDKEELKNDIERLSSYRNHIQGDNRIILNQLKQRTQPEPKMELSITEPAPEEQPSSSKPTEEPRKPEKESELPIIPYQEFSLTKLLKITEPEFQSFEVLPEKHISSSSSSSSISPVSSPPASPRKQEITPDIIKIIAHETQEPEITPEKHASSSSTSPSISPTPTPPPSPREEVIFQTPPQATEGESSDTPEDNSSETLEPGTTIPGAGLQISDIPEPKENEITPPPTTTSTTSSIQPTTGNFSKVTPPSSMPSLPWYSRLMKQISAFFYAIDDFFWQIYG